MPPVEHHAALARVVVPPAEAPFRVRNVVDERLPPAHRTAARRLDEHDVRAHVAQKLPRERNALVGELDHANACERAHTTPCARSVATSSTLNPSNSVKTSSVCSPTHGPPRSIDQDVSEKRTGRPSTRTDRKST